ncbi:zinc-dependent metalloprotease [Pendulispora brunnea]|uniref:Zinc-dependent metalloprotease n=1 Tax=Pendulispora brunnea TaxID=2905690 RepID=A0ABZ2K9N0_9BACT
MSKIRSARRLLLPLAVAAVGCTSENSPQTNDSDVLQRGQAFVAIPRANGGNNESFYLAVSKKELDRRYFLSADMKQAYPGRAASSAVRSLGTRVVAFHEQDGKILVLDVQDGRTSKDAISVPVDPLQMVEAYPIVDDYAPFFHLAEHDHYVLFDPAAGIRRFGVAPDSYESQATSPLRLRVDLSYLQSFRSIHDGAAFEQVFAGTLNDASGAPRREPTVSGTLGIALRRYAEGENFRAANATGFSRPYFLRAEPLRAKNPGDMVRPVNEFRPVAKWNIHPGMKPIRWRISRPFVDLGTQYPKYDIVGAIQAGVENWNAVFGFKALEAHVASTPDAQTDDDENDVIYDNDPTYRFAFADSRVNPNTGEIRGASVYFNAVWLREAIERLDPQPGSSAPDSARVPQILPPALPITWGEFRPTPLCTLWAPGTGLPQNAATRVDPARAVEKFLTFITLHEIGHTLGLRHNFKGSLVPSPQQNSVMDYLDAEDVVAADRDHPGPYDDDAIRLLYGFSSSEPAQPFCTDDSVGVDPTCMAYDHTEDPLAKFWGPTYNGFLESVLRNQDPTGSFMRAIHRFYLTGLSGFLISGTSSDQARAWSQLDQLLAVGIDHTADNINYPGYTNRLSAYQNHLLHRLFFDPPNRPGSTARDLVLTGDALAAFTTSLKGVIVNGDRYRGWDTRRTAVDVLKKMQVQAAYDALLAARASLAASRPKPGDDATGGEATRTDDLIAWIDSVTHPYYK